jgi:opacity protein-like surface antigen
MAGFIGTTYPIKMSNLRYNDGFNIGNHMKKTLLGLVAITASFASFAQTSNFTGTNLGANVSFAAASTSLTLDTTKIDGLGQQNMGLILSASQGFEMSKSSVILLGLDYSLSESKSGQISSDSTITLKAKNLWTLSVAPGFLISDQTLAFLKVGYEGAQTVGTVTGTGATELTKNITGTSLGFGMRTMVNKTTYLQAEAKQVTYGSAKFETGTTDFTSRATVASIGLGLKF